MTTLTMELIEEAQRVLQPIISRTPLVRADKFRNIYGSRRKACN